MKKYFVFDEDKQMLLVNGFKDWLEPTGKGDALWRTSLGYIAYSDYRYLKGILRAFKKGDGGKFQARRCNPFLGVDTVSRDQVIMAWVSLYINKDKLHLTDLVYNTPFKLSNKYNQTIGMWLWGRGLTGCKILGYMSQLTQILTLLINVPLNKLIKLILGWKRLSKDELEELLRTKGEAVRYEVLTNKFKEFLWSVEYPGYALHLAAWRNFTGPKGILKKIVNKLIRIDAGKENILLRQLTGEIFTEEVIANVKPMEEWQWSVRFNKMTRQRALPEDYDISGSNLDVDILYRINGINKLNSKNEK